MSTGDSKMIRSALWIALGASLAQAALAQSTSPSPAQRELREIYKELVEINTTDSVGSCTEAAQALAARLKAAGLPAQDVQVIVPPGGPKKGNLVARYRGTGAKKPLMLLGHLDVVEAKREDWQRDPFRLVEENGYFYARGAADDKAMVAVFAANLIRYRREGYRPQRDLIQVATCDEEIVPSQFSGIVYLLKNHRDLIDAEFALNEGGIGLLDKNGNYQRMSVQAGEKVFQTFQLEVTNPGGHSMMPVKDNAITHLAGGLARLGAYDFPFKLSATTRAYFERMSGIETGQTAADMKAILREPTDAEAITRLSANPLNNSTFRTTCVATMLEAGHATNALPQRARATVNCRILPGESVAEVQNALARVLADDKIRITPTHEPTLSPPPPLSPEIVGPIEKVSGEMWPGVPVVPTLLAGATDGRFTINAGIPTYGVNGMFRDPDGSGVHGLNERIRVRSLYEGHEFLYRLVKLYGGGR
jgi:acetylornithine deacetylase/succinyl-diaminopimelate desuccinylase-like protein